MFEFPSLNDILQIHENQIKIHGGSTGIRDLGLLQSALAMPQASFGGQYLHGDVYEMAAAYLFHNHRREFGPEVVHRIKKQTGVEAWQGPNMGLIGCDENKIYVYHRPEMQRKVNELVARFARPETQDIQFIAEARFFSLSESRTEAGVPILNKIPYVNRRFTNTAISRETQTLNVVVTIKRIEAE